MKFIKRILKYLNRKEEIENRAIAQCIGEYYLGKNIGDYKKTQEDITILGITQVEHKQDTIIITLQRCGILIGRRGENIDALQKFLATKTKYTKLNIKEDKIISWLIPYDYSDYEMEY
jgi:ribosomal protein S3